MGPDLHQVVDAVEQVVRGKRGAVERVVTALLAGGHVLVEDVPGVGKTMLARALGRALDLTHARVQCTPDLLPSDVTGVSVYRAEEARFEFHPGPVFTNILLVDEINRATPRTQSALLEAMEERQVSVDGTPQALAAPFFLVATQNPIELTGTFPLPEAQLDRFLLQISLGYPDDETEVDVLEAQKAHHPIRDVHPVADEEAVREAQEAVGRIYVHRSVLRYIQQVVATTRRDERAAYGVSPRGAVALMRTAQAMALLRGEGFVTPDHVKELAPDVLGHRVVLEPRARAEGETGRRLIDRALRQVSVLADVDPSS